MKTNVDLPSVKIILIFLLSFFLQSALFSQPDYKFTSRIHESGPNLQVGAMYLYQNVKTGVDARVTIMNLTGGITVNDIDGSGGFIDALQPIINVPAYSNGYVEMKIDFYQSGTLNPSVQTELPITPIDVDGQMYTGMPLYEYDEIYVETGYTMFQLTGGQLNMTMNNKWVRGKNNAAIDYPGIDTTQRSVMFTTVNGGVSTLTVRVGAENTSSTNTSRLRSLYFKKFIYSNHGILSYNSLLNFSGIATNNKVDLKFVLEYPLKVKQVIIEKAGIDQKFQTIQEIITTTSKSSYETQDVSAAGTSFYRLKLIHEDGKMIYSNVLRFETKNTNGTRLKVFPSLVHDKVTIQLQNNTAETATLQIFDYNGKSVHTQKIKTQIGMQNVTVDGLDQLARGNYVVITRVGSELLQQKIIKL